MEVIRIIRDIRVCRDDRAVSTIKHKRGFRVIRYTGIRIITDLRDIRDIRVIRAISVIKDIREIRGIRMIRKLGMLEILGLLGIRVSWTISFTIIIGDIMINRGIEIFKF
jgi:hypothetical protein